MNDQLKNQRILIVDDTPENIDVLIEILSEYRRSVATNGEKALQIAGSGNPPDLILLDIMMPGMDGYEVCQKLKSEEKTKSIPVIFLTGMADEESEKKGLELGAVDYITKPISPPIVLERVKNHLLLKLARENLENQNDILEEKVKERTKELALTQDVIIFSMAVVAEFRDPETGGHIKRTQNYIKALASQLQNYEKYSPDLDDQAIELLYKSAPLHDIGKVGVPDSILMKPGKLTDEEFDEMKKHPTYGRDAISSAEKMLGGESTFLKYAREIAYSHQEKWDGSGYPEGLKGDAIPISARLMAVADVYDALISKRVYKPPFPHKEAIEIISAGKGKHFDPVMVEALLEIEDAFRNIALEFDDS
ncbi:MAG: two-component system response regulator [Halieaceae bacterium]|jgi:putative two-component system response regulator|nr:two-component system response regulator [Halieaceae bacterium]